MNDFLKQYKKRKHIIFFIQLSISILFILLWEILARYNIINSFITSYPSKIIITLFNLLKEGILFKHILVTLKELLISFSITMSISLILSIFIFSYDLFDKIIDPYLNIFNSLPKVSLAPLLIIYIGTNNKCIILMSILISIVVSTESISTSFKNTNKSSIIMLKSFNASKLDIIKYVVLPSNIKEIISSSKVTMSLCLIGVITGEFLTSKEGIGYLIINASQVFNLTLVITYIIVLLIISFTLYIIINKIKNHLS